MDAVVWIIRRNTRQLIQTIRSPALRAKRWKAVKDSAAEFWYHFHGRFQPMKDPPHWERLHLTPRLVMSRLYQMPMSAHREIWRRTFEIELAQARKLLDRIRQLKSTAVAAQEKITIEVKAATSGSETMVESALRLGKHVFDKRAPILRESIQTFRDGFQKGIREPGSATVVINNLQESAEKWRQKVVEKITLSTSTLGHSSANASSVVYHGDNPQWSKDMREQRAELLSLSDGRGYGDDPERYAERHSKVVMYSIRALLVLLFPLLVMWVQIVSLDREGALEAMRLERYALDHPDEYHVAGTYRLTTLLRGGFRTSRIVTERDFLTEPAPDTATGILRWIYNIFGMASPHTQSENSSMRTSALPSMTQVESVTLILPVVEHVVPITPTMAKEDPESVQTSDEPLTWSAWLASLLRSPSPSN